MVKTLKNSYISFAKITRLLITIFPFATFMGPYINFFGINFSNIFSLILCIFTLKSILKMKFKNILVYISFFFFMILYALGSLIWGKYNIVGLSIILPLIAGFVAMTFIALLNKDELQLFIKSISFFTITVFIIALLEIFTGKYLFFNNIDFINRANRFNLHYPGVTFTNPNDLAQFLLVGFPILVFKYIEVKKQLIKAIVLLFISIFIMINADSRLALISSVLIIAFFINLFMSNSLKKIREVMLIIIISLIFIGILSFIGVNISNFNILNNFLKIDITQGYFSARATIYIEVIKLALDNFIFGTGLGGSYSVNLMPPHNMFLFIFADFGVLFATGFIIVLISAFLRLYKLRNNIIFGCHFNMIICSIFIIFPIFSSISSGNEQRKIIWVFMGLVFALINNNTKITSIIQKSNRIKENIQINDN
jgi:O-antigen ligase